MAKMEYHLEVGKISLAYKGPKQQSFNDYSILQLHYNLLFHIDQNIGQWYNSWYSMRGHCIWQ